MDLITGAGLLYKRIQRALAHIIVVIIIIILFIARQKIPALERYRNSCSIWPMTNKKSRGQKTGFVNFLLRYFLRRWQPKVEIFGLNKIYLFIFLSIDCLPKIGTVRTDQTLRTGRKTPNYLRANYHYCCV